MCDVRAEAGDLQVILHNDDETPKEFVIELLHSVFKKSIADSAQLTETVDHDGQQFAGPIRATLPTSCLQLLDNASVPRVIRS
jgi:ATP-dependent Clp protease adapter protein ClpS